jgi:uncharacterized protein
MDVCWQDVRKSGGSLSLSQRLELPRVQAENPDVLDITSVVMQGTAESTGRRMRIHGVVTAQLTYKCSRCLEPFIQTLSTDFDESVTTDPQQAQDEIWLVNADCFSIDPWIEQVVNLAFEFCPVCQPDCQGLCPLCGNNRNTHPCNCVEDVRDVRLTALAQWVEDSDNEPVDER